MGASRSRPNRLGRPPVRVHLEPDQRAHLERVLRSHKASQRDVRRARIILACADTPSAQEAARRAGVSLKTLYLWRRRFLKEGFKGLKDRSRSGAPMRYDPVQRLQIIALACEPASQEHGLNGWTLDRIRQAILDRHVAESIGRSTVHRILEKADLKPHKVRGWVHSPDPQFREKVQEVTELYLDPPEDALVISVDEKTAMQARQRKYPDEPSLPGRPLRREFEYVRHGTQSLIAGLNVHTGRISAQVGRRRKARDLLRFMNFLAAEYPDVQIHIIWDNLNIHKGKRWEMFNRRHGGRFHFHYTPLHASWVNQIELWFSILQTKCLRHGSFQSTRALKTAVLSFVSYWNEKLARPFRWTFTGYPLQSGIPLEEVA